MSICMVKKNTLLYLDKNLVKYAKERGLNISQITENAIKQQLFPYLSIGEKALFDFKGYLEELKNNKQCFFLPLKLKGVKLKNVGKFDYSFHTEFKQFNVVNAPFGYGKTTLLRSIAYTLGLDDFPLRNLLCADSTEGYIRINVDNNKELYSKISIRNNQELFTDGRTRCILLDDAMDIEKFINITNTKHQLMLTSFQEFLHTLRELDIQIILTASFTDDKVYNFYSNIFPGCNFINLERDNH